MEHHLASSNNNPASDTNIVVLDYLFGEGDNLQAYQVVRFANNEPWQVLQDGELLSTLNKNNGEWTELEGSHMSKDRLIDIGKFIDKQHFNFLPGKIKQHWADAVQEVIMQSDSCYMIVCKEGVEFERFKNVFTASIGNLVEDEWSIEFKVYDADFNNEFVARVF